MSTTSGPIVPGNTGMSQLLLPTVRVPVLFLALVLASMGRVLELAASFVGIPFKCALQDSPMLALRPGYTGLAAFLPDRKTMRPPGRATARGFHRGRERQARRISAGTSCAR